MRIRVLSDLHFEFMPDGGRAFVRSLTDDCDILVLAGDVAASGGIESALRMFCRKFRLVLFVIGNHEYYGGSVHGTRTRIQSVESETPNLHVLDNDRVEIDGRWFAGTTLWFAKPKDDQAKRRMNDFRMIRGFEPWVYERHKVSTEWLAREVRPGDVVVTHYLPSMRSVPEQFVDSPLNCLFVSDVEHVIRKRKPALWIHGHTHNSCDYTIGKTRVVCNPYGYTGHEMNPKFDPALTIEVP